MKMKFLPRKTMILQVVAILGISGIWRSAVSWNLNHGSSSAKCEKLEISYCQGLRYNITAMPNFLGHENQAAAERGLAAYMPLIQYNCSRDLRFFLCAAFAPVCSEHVAMQIPACKSLCLSVRKDCEHTLEGISLPWPFLLDCDRFPDSGNALCVQPPQDENLSSDTLPPALLLEQQQQRQQQQPVARPVKLAITSTVKTGYHHKCPPRFVQTPNTAVTSCSPRCGSDAYYQNDDKRSAERWMTGWAWLCFLSTLFTLLTFWVDPNRFRYPERPIVFLALCYNLVSVAYIVRSAVGPEFIGCASQPDGPSYVPVYDGLSSMTCTIWWLARYYLGLASSVWWTIFCGCWFLSARNEWSSEALHNVACYMHAVAWTLPIFFVAGSLYTRNVAADELTGICQVRDEGSLWLEVMPHGLLLLLGCLLGVYAGAALCRVRRVIRSAGRSSAKLERLMTRLGVFGALYCFPALGGLICAIREAQVRPGWRDMELLAAMERRNLPNYVPGPIYRDAGLEVALLRIFLALGIGITSGMWVWSGKTCRAWSRLMATPPTKPKAVRPVHHFPPHHQMPFPAYKHNIVDIA